jgi:hypothetical protein
MQRVSVILTVRKATQYEGSVGVDGTPFWTITGIQNTKLHVTGVE